MVKYIDKIIPKKKHTLLVLLLICIAIIFETSQQLFYVKRFNLAENITFMELLKTQTYKWMVWLGLSFILIKFTKKQTLKKAQNLNYSKYALLIIGLVFLCIIIITIIQIIISSNSLSLDLLIKDYITFFTFQKAPIFTLSYIALAIIVHYYFTNEQLYITVQGLSELKESNAKIYKKLSRDLDDHTPILNIKIGNKRKIIPVKDISWIEADDYCVKVYTINGQSYSMRSTLKAMEDKLSHNFLRVHRRAIANMDLIKEINWSNSPKIILKNNIEIPISKSNIKSVKEFIG